MLPTRDTRDYHRSQNPEGQAESGASRPLPIPLAIGYGSEHQPGPVSPAGPNRTTRREQGMKVTTVTATLRYSAEAKGAWRSIEVGAEATLTNSDESWETAQQELYNRLG